MSLNQSASLVCDRLLKAAEQANVRVHQSGARIVDCGLEAAGGLEAGLALAEVCLAGQARVDVVSGDASVWRGPFVHVHTDRPMAACMASQYAGWKVAEGDFFGMGSGPMRAAYGHEELFDQIGYRESPEAVIGVLECSSLPPDSICRGIAEKCRVPVENLTLMVARTASIAGCVQVVARSVETALHKLHELGFDLGRVRSGFGSAPLPPVAKNDVAGIGRTNDAVLYGGEVTLWVDGDDTSLEELGPRAPSNASKDYGEPFGDVFKRYEYDFYKIDPLLFSPAVVSFWNVETGSSFRFGETRADVLQKSFLN